MIVDRLGLTAGWAQRERFVALFTDFGEGGDTLDLWRAWLDDPQRGRSLDLVAIAARLPDAGMLRTAHAATPRAALAGSLADRWPLPMCGLHRLRCGSMQLLLAVGELSRWLKILTLNADAIVAGSDIGGFADPVRLAKALARHAAPGARLASTLPAGPAADALRGAGFRVDAQASSKTTMAAFAPPFGLRRRGAPAGPPRAAPPAGRDAVIVGAGLAGCAAAWALAEGGWSSLLIDRRADVAAEASGNPAGLFHATVHADDGVHARFSRAAAIEAAAAVRLAVADHGVAGAADGLLRLNSGATVEAMREWLERLQLPPAFVQALDAERASALAGLRLEAPAWFFPSGGWVDPAGLARSFLRRAGDAATLRLSTEVAALKRDGESWSLVDRRGIGVARSATVILANAGNALRLAGADLAALQSVRGQVSWIEAAASSEAWPAPRLPVAGSGYMIPARDGRLLFGATSQAGDADPAAREADHRFNVDRLQSLSPGAWPEAAAARCNGRVGWRCVAPDRLPLIGAVPDTAAEVPAGSPIEAWPRLPGLHLFNALGSRGITWAAVGAQLLAAMIAGAPLPLERPLVRAIDPARFLWRDKKRR